MKILYLCSDLGIPILGNKGAAVHVRAMASAFTEAGHEVVVASPILNKSPWERPASLEASVLHIPPSDEAKDAAFAIRAFDDALGSVAQTLPGEIRRILYNQEIQKRIARRFDRHPPDFIYERASLYGTAGAAVARQLNRPLVVELNAPLSLEQDAYRGAGIAQLAAKAEHLTLMQADAVLVVSSVLREHVESLGVSAKRIRVLPNGVDTRRFRPAKADPTVRHKWAMGDGPILGFVGGLRPWHGIEVLPALLQRLQPDFPDVRLAVVGDGPLREQLHGDLRERGLGERATVTGLLPHDGIADMIRTFDVALAPYPNLEHTFYFSPLKLFEYMACGVPVVAPRVGQIEEVVRDGETGLLYPTGDLDALTASCKRLLSDAALRHNIGCEASRLVRSRYTWGHNARKVVDLVSSLIHKNGSPK